MYATVRMPDGAETAVELGMSDRLADLLTKVQEATGVKPGEFMLVMDGVRLDVLDKLAPLAGLGVHPGVELQVQVEDKQVMRLKLQEKGVAVNWASLQASLDAKDTEVVHMLLLLRPGLLDTARAECMASWFGLRALIELGMAEFTERSLINAMNPPGTYYWRRAAPRSEEEVLFLMQHAPTTHPALLFRAVLSSMPLVVKQLLSAGHDVKDTEYPVVKAAVLRKNIDIARMLLAAGADVSAAGFVDDTPGSLHVEAPVHIAAASDCPEFVTLLLDYGADPNHIARARTPLHCAASSNGGRAARILMERGARLPEERPTRISVLYIAAKARNVACVELFLEKGASPVGCKRDHNPLHVAVSVPMVRALLARGASVNELNKCGQTPLHTICCAAKSSTDVEPIRLLLEAGADPNAIDNSNETPLHDLLRRGCKEGVMLLLAYGASPNAIGTKGLPPLFLALKERCHCDLIVALLDAGAKVKGELWQGRTALTLALQGSHDAIVKQLIAFGADVNETDSAGRVPIHEALQRRWALGDSCSLVACLLQAGADPNAPACPGLKPWRPLHAAARRPSPEVTKRLLAAGADPNAQTSDGRTPLHVFCDCESGAFYSDHKGYISAMVASGAEVDARCSSGRTPLHVACTHLYDRVGCIQDLLDNGANPCSRQKVNKDTVLHTAVQNGGVWATDAVRVVVNILMKHGANPRQPNIVGATPSDLAGDAVKEVLEKGAQGYVFVETSCSSSEEQESVVVPKGRKRLRTKQQRDAAATERAGKKRC